MQHNLVNDNFIMKKRYNLFAAILMAMPLALTSCSDVLNMAPGGNMNLEEVWQDNDKVSAYLNTCYKNFMLHNDLYFFWCRMPVTCSDEAWDGDDRDVNWAAPAKYYAGDATASAHPFWSVTGQVLHVYTRLQLLPRQHRQRYCHQRERPQPLACRGSSAPRILLHRARTRFRMRYAAHGPHIFL